MRVLSEHTKDILESKVWHGYEKYLNDYNRLLSEIKGHGYCSKFEPIKPVPQGAKIAFGKAERLKLREIIYEAEKLLEVVKQEENDKAVTAKGRSKELVFETIANTYKPVSLIGNGGAGVVYKVKDIEDKEFALKYMPPNKISKDKLKRFRNEIGFCGKNTHKNILTVLDTGFVDCDGVKCPFYVMPLFNGSLRQLMINGIAREKVLPYFSQLLDGVEAAHLQGVWHRDLKPENILVDSTVDSLIVADFGIAHFEEELLQTIVETSHDSRLANFQYAAPEQRVKGKMVDQRSDIYALGLILNEMYTGKLVHGTGFTRITQIDEKYGYLDALVDSMLKQSIDERPQTIDSVKRELIALKSECVSRQKIGELSKQVIPDTEIEDSLILNPPKLIDAKYSDGVLTMQLSCDVNSKWGAIFRNPREGHSSLWGKGPATFRISGRSLIVSSNGNDAQEIVNYAKGYVEMANRGYKSEVENENRRQIEQEKQRLKEALERAKKEQIINQNLKI
jgi:serine/threonine protein kinase